MAELTAQKVKAAARQFGADLVGIGDPAHYEGVPPEQDPRRIAPACRSIIGLGFRILRGSLRGIVEGTQFYQYPAMSVCHLEEYVVPEALRRLACLLEDHGFEGVVQRSVPDRLPAAHPGTNPERFTTHKIGFSRAVAPDRPAPDVLLDFRHAAFVCGMGEIGLGGFFLTPAFGPLQRFAFLLTDAELACDPPYSGTPLCDRCGQCRTACPGHAISDTDEETAELAGRKILHARLDSWQCKAYYMGAHAATNPFLPPDAYAAVPDGDRIARGEKRLSPEEVENLKATLSAAYGGVAWGYNACLCGRACYRACLAHLEEQGRLTWQPAACPGRRRGG